MPRVRDDIGPDKIRTDRGLTLIELVVAMAIFALVAVMGLQALTGTLRARDRAETRSSEVAGLARTTALLRADLDAILPMLFFPPEGGIPQSALRAGQDALAFSIGGQTGFDPDDTDPGMQRVTWRIDPEAGLIRQSWPTLWPATAAQQTPQLPVMAGVQGLRVRSFWPVQGWVTGTDPSEPTAPTGAARDGDIAFAATEVYSDALPLALEVTLITADFGALTFIEALR